MSSQPFTPVQAAELSRIAARYQERASAILPLLHYAQRVRGHLDEASLIYVADLAGVPHVRAFEVATYYTQFFLRMRGRYVIWVCRNLTCTLHGCDRLLAALRKELDVEEGGTTSDGLFTLATAECLGACDQAPVLLVDEDLHTHVSPGSLQEILASYRRKS